MYFPLRFDKNPLLHRSKVLAGWPLRRELLAAGAAWHGYGSNLTGLSSCHKVPCGVRAHGLD